MFCYYFSTGYTKNKFYVSKISQKQLPDKNNFRKFSLILNNFNEKNFVKTISKNLFSAQHLNFSTIHGF